MPQYLCREIHQSLASLIQSWNLALPAHSGYQVTLETSSSIRSLIWDARRNHCSVALKMIGVLHLQQ